MAKNEHPAEKERREKGDLGSPTRQKYSGTVAENTTLWKYLLEKDVRQIEESLQEKGTDVNMRDCTFGWTPLLLAANNGDESVVKMILEAKAKADLGCHERNTALMIAARCNNIDAVRCLISKQVDLDVQNTNGFTAIMWSALNGYEDLSTLLMQAKADYLRGDEEGRTSCMWAARHGHLGVVESLLSCGLNLAQCDNYGATVMDHAEEHMEMRSMVHELDQVNKLLAEAAKSRDTQALKTHINSGANLNIRDESGMTPFMWATLNGDVEMAREIVRKGGRASFMNEDGETMQELAQPNMAETLKQIMGANQRMSAAAKEADWEAVDFEINVGAWVNARDEDGRTVLMHAAKHDNPAVCESIYGKGACLEDVDTFGWTALHFAVSGVHIKTVSMLYYLGANIKAKTFQGDNMLHMAARSNDGAMVQLLLAGSADMEVENCEKMSACQFAANLGLPVALSTLLAFQCDANKRDHRDRTPFHLAVRGGHTEAVRVLIEPLQSVVSPVAGAKTAAAPAAVAKKKAKEKEVDDENKSPSKKATAEAKGKAKSKAVAKAKGPPGPTKTTQNITKKLGPELVKKIHSHLKAAVSKPGVTFRKIFDKYDTDKSGNMDVKEFRKMIRGEFKIPLSTLSAKDVEAFVAALDEDGSGDLDLDEIENFIEHGVAAVGGVQQVARKKINLSVTIEKVGSDPLALSESAMRRWEKLGALTNPLGAKAAAKQVDRDGKTGLHFAVERKDVAMCILLVKGNADTNMTDKDRKTPLMYAVMIGSAAKHVVFPILEGKANVQARDDKKKTALDMCTDPVIKTMLERYMIFGTLGPGPETLKEPPDPGGRTPSRAPSKAARPERSCWRVKLGNLPRNLTTDLLEEAVSSLLRKLCVPAPVRIQIVADPITSRPKGWAFVDFYDAAAAELCVRGHGQAIRGETITVDPAKEFR